MLLVKTKIRPSKIDGIGIFADQFIPKGTLIWKFMPDFDRIIDKSELEKLPELAIQQFLNRAYLNPKTNKYVWYFDDAGFFNHSDNPNVIGIDSPDDYEGIDIAARDIQIGEELTCNYKEFDADSMSQDVLNFDR